MANVASLLQSTIYPSQNTGTRRTIRIKLTQWFTSSFLQFSQRRENCKHRSEDRCKDLFKKGVPFGALVASALHAYVAIVKVSFKYVQYSAVIIHV